jgi:hypothetical protein
MPYKNKADTYAMQLRHRQKNYDNLWELLLSSSCTDCGEGDPIVLDFDHLPEFEKKFEIAQAVLGSTRSWKSILLEISKCEIVCANCHRKRTAQRSNSKRYRSSTPLV